ncbi:MAG: hypothetical protein C4519_02635 [Desulfobacteraceae bacterium]|nr:MAG: hypothetical protein C4519_02635 [Desulfobacteraceae bacterium]
MTTNEEARQKPLWLAIEEKLLEPDPQAFSGQNFESTIHRLAGELDKAGYKVSKYGGGMLELRWAVDDMRQAGRPLLKDLKDAIASFTLDDMSDPYLVADRLINDVGKTWPKLKQSERRAEVIRMVEKTRLDLLVAKAKGLPGDEGIRLLIEEKVAPGAIIGRLEITQDKLDQVNADIARERAERARVANLLEAVKGKPDEERIRHLFTNNISEKLILEMAKVEQGAIDSAKQAMEAELKEKQRLEEEAAARKKAEAAGPALEDIPPNEMLEYIASIREILEFSDQEKEIRVMCEQSSIPKALVDIVVSEPARLDELEKAAQG